MTNARITQDTVSQTSLFLDETCIDALSKHRRMTNQARQNEAKMKMIANTPLILRKSEHLFFHDDLMMVLREKRNKKLAVRLSNKDVKTANKASSLFEEDLAASLEGQVTHYASGVLSPAYWRAYTSINHPVCVTAVEIGDERLTRVCNYLRAGGTVLMDSGAFLYREDFDAMPWTKVEEMYRAVSQAASENPTQAKVTFILPDAVGSQSDSLAALREWGAKIQAAIGPHHERLLPIQRGDLTPSLYIKAAVAALGHSRVDGIAIPCKAKAFPAEHLKDLKNLGCDIPCRVHLLGLSENRKNLANYLTHLSEVWPDAKVTCDAVMHRAAVGENEIITAIRKEIIEGPITNMVERLVDLTDPLDEQDESKAEAMCNARPWLDICAARHQIVLDYLVSEWGPWATEVATRAYITGLEPSVLRSYWKLIDAVTESFDEKAA
jgi:hypothetical protein